MSFAEFQIRLFAYRRIQDREWEKIRIVAWYSMIGSHMNPKTLPKSIGQFMKLDLDARQNSRVSEAQKQRFMEAMQDYIKQTS